MAWYDDVWNTIKDIGKGVGDVVSTVAPILPFILKKGGSVKEFKDTAENRAKILRAWNRAHPGRKLTMAKLNKAMASKGKK